MTVTVGAIDTCEEWLSAHDGVSAPSSPGGRGGFITDVIIELGLASEDHVESALEEARFVGRQPGAILVEREQLTTNDLARAIAERNGLHHVDLENFEVDDDAVRLIDRNAAMRYCALPIAFAPDGTLIVALADPLDAIAVSDIGVITKSEPLPVVADADALRARIERLPKAQRLVAPAPPAEEPEQVAAPTPVTAPPIPEPAQFEQPSTQLETPPAPPPVAHPPAAGEPTANGAGALEALRAESERAKAALAELEREREAERDRAAHTIQALTAGTEGELERLRNELEAERAARLELEALREEEAEARVPASDGTREGQLAQHAETTRALEKAAAEKEELRLQLKRERGALADLQRQQDLDRVQQAQATEALDESGVELEALRARVESLEEELERDRAAHAEELRRLDERGSDVASAGDEIQRALAGLNEVTEAAQSAAARIEAAVKRPDRAPATRSQG